MLRSRSKLAARRPLADVSNSSKRSKTGKKKAPTAGGDSGTGASACVVNRLLLARSHLPYLISQVDELVARASAAKTISKEASQAIESFTHALCDMCMSLKTWVPKLQEAFEAISAETENKSSKTSDTSYVYSEVRERNDVTINENNHELEVSPSPLVSWRAGTCTVDSGRQLFLLTPLPKSRLLSSKRPALSRPLVAKSANANFHGSLGRPILSNAVKNMDDTPVMVEAVAPSSRPCSVKNKNEGYPQNSTDLKTADIIENLASRYQELCGLESNYNPTDRRKLDESLDWFFSPPKTCVLLEPSDEKQKPTPANVMMLATPVWNGFGSTVKIGKQAGENTLKRELWTRFEAVSASGLRFDASVFHETGKKGFLDMLEEASCESTASKPR